MYNKNVREGRGGGWGWGLSEKCMKGTRGFENSLFVAGSCAGMKSCKILKYTYQENSATLILSSEFQINFVTHAEVV